jgi:hypothetical protein
MWLCFQDKYSYSHRICRETQLFSARCVLLQEKQFYVELQRKGVTINMMPQMESGEPMERPGSAYRGYEGQPGASQPPHGTSYQVPPASKTYDDNFTEAVAQRIVQILNQKSGEKIYTQSSAGSKPSAGQRLALAIVSIVALVPLAAILFSILGPIGIIAFAIACGAIVLVNVVFNVAAR